MAGPALDWDSTVTGPTTTRVPPAGLEPAVRRSAVVPKATAYANSATGAGCPATTYQEVGPFEGHRAELRRRHNCLLD